jgi:hypothetical protein
MILILENLVKLLTSVVRSPAGYTRKGDTQDLCLLEFTGVGDRLMFQSSSTNPIRFAAPVNRIGLSV